MAAYTTVPIAIISSITSIPHSFMDERTFKNWLPLLLAGLTAYWGYKNWNSQQLFSTRPERQTWKDVSLLGDQFVPARLWQDPFEAVKDVLATNDLHQQPQELIRQITSHARDGKIHLIGVLIGGASYPEQQEQRLRSRYALQMAMSSKDYIPTDNSFMGVMTIPWPLGGFVKTDMDAVIEAAKRYSQPQLFTNIPASPPAIFTNSTTLSNPGSTNTTTIVKSSPGTPSPLINAAVISMDVNITLPSRALGSTTPTPPSDGAKPSASDSLLSTNILGVPFEWFSPTREAHDNTPILVVWLREEAFLDLPVTRIQLLIQGFLSGTENYFKQISILGPGTSDTLRAFATDTTGKNPKFQKPSLNLFSFQATAPDSIVLNNPAFENSPTRLALSQSFSNNQSNVRLINCIATDDQLATLIAEELDQRDFDIKGSAADHIALVTEADTTYGQGLRNIFAAALTKEATNENTRAGIEQSSKPFLYKLDYLRGLDGVTAAESKKYSETNASANLTMLLPQKNHELAQGESQFDYARRLAKLLKNQSVASKRAGTGEIRAIGILGSDIYDKMILLQAFRDEFKDDLFFTTDMDARLLNPSANEWNRNLIVASSFPLETDELSFRSCYQTALYRACRMALEGKTNSPPAPILFEIGRTRAVRLPLADGYDSLDPIGWWMRWVISPLLAAAVGLACMLGALRNVARIYYKIFDYFTKKPPASPVPCELNEPTKNSEDAHRRRRRALFIVSVIFLAVFIPTIVMARRDGMHGNGEPFAWLEGTSVWPTIITRIFVIGFCVGAISWAWFTGKIRVYEFFSIYKLKYNQAKAAKTALENKEAYRTLHGWYCWFFENKRLSSITHWEENDEPSKNPCTEKRVDAQTDLFDRYLVLAQGNHRFWRVACLSIALLLLYGGVLMATGGFPKVPYRGSCSHHWEMATLILSICGILFLISYVIDVARLTERYIKQLGTGVTRWPDEVVKKKETELGFDSSKPNEELPKPFREVISGLVDVEFVADYTIRINTVLYLPYIALFLLLISRNSYFDRWPWPPGLKFIFIFNFTLTFVCSWCIRRVASKVKADAIHRMHLAQMSKNINPSDQKRIKHIIKFIDDIKGGAYSSWLLDPTVIGALIPTGGAGLIALLKVLFG